MICAQCCKGFDGIGMVCQVCASDGPAPQDEYVDEVYSEEDADLAPPCNRFYRFTASLADVFILTVISVLIFLVLYPQSSVISILSLPSYNLFVSVLAFFYSIIFEPFAGTTFGKAIHGISLRGTNGGRITIVQAVLRHLGKYAFLLPLVPMSILLVLGRPQAAFMFSAMSSVVFVVSYLMYLFTDEHQALHDLLSGCLLKQSRDASPFWALLVLIVVFGSAFGLVHVSYDEMKANFERDRSSISRYR